ncbi:antiviral RADAR system adenosine triphosphatase RdrA [Pseudomonas mosselii]|uniref:antiviral RADAR system adenosine triphosphatase RdrA n=1 Tax=Pseudomonas mosselii TaxID=78327 RepID=UPI0007813EA6|nr:antiviral RADAR system adenosine triphosphatase RdrA [Pseudomonas mosselii]KXG83663.1 hypothetical protein AXZ07_00665 [Pseudomonas mosselii]
MASSQSNDSRIRFPIEQKEQAAQRDHSTLLARDVYAKLSGLLAENLYALPDEDNLDQHRAHRAILIDGKRGTGKSSVLVNLSSFLASHGQKKLVDEIHVLQPVDPTLLEESDDLFLNVIVAAIIRDKAVANALSTASPKAEEFHHQLQILGKTLEALQSQREKYGLDKLRAFMGSHDINQQVHELFKRALGLVNKKLLVLPIDDVDTSLNKAFENLEVVRRYLTSPYVQPIISGDLELYLDVTWRDFHKKLTNGVHTPDARGTAEDLAKEYQRKIMPLPLRLKMPTASQYLSDSKIFLCKDDEDYIPLPTFWRWIDALLNERTNSQPNKRLSISISTVRELAQLVFAFRSIIPRLHTLLETAEVPLEAEWAPHRFLFMPSAAVPALEHFSRDFKRAQRQSEKHQREAGRLHAYTNFFAATDVQRSAPNPEQEALISASKTILLAHLRHENPHTPACLVLEADLHLNALRKYNADTRASSLFKPRLFHPMQLPTTTIEQFPETLRRQHLSEWYNISPTYLLDGVSSDEYYPYALPEAGQATTSYKRVALSPSGQFIKDLLLHRSFYTESKSAQMIFTGRLFELVVTSLVTDIEPHDIHDLIIRPPFYSVPSLLEADDDTEELSTDVHQDSGYDDTLIQFTNNIKRWRQRHALEHRPLSSWFIFNCMNSVYSSAWDFNPPVKNGQSPTRATPAALFLTARRIYRGLWNAFACFEKGDTFGLPPVTTSFKVSDRNNFEQSLSYKQNIQAFMRKQGDRAFGEEVQAYTYCLADHPLLALIEDLITTLDRPQESDEKAMDDESIYSSRLVTNHIKKYYNITGQIEESFNEIKPAPDDLTKIFRLCLDDGISRRTIHNNRYFELLRSMIRKAD